MTRLSAAAGEANTKKHDSVRGEAGSRRGSHNRRRNAERWEPPIAGEQARDRGSPRQWRCATYRVRQRGSSSRRATQHKRRKNTESGEDLATETGLLLSREKRNGRLSDAVPSMADDEAIKTAELAKFSNLSSEDCASLPVPIACTTIPTLRHTHSRPIPCPGCRRLREG